MRSRLYISLSVLLIGTACLCGALAGPTSVLLPSRMHRIKAPSARHEYAYVLGKMLFQFRIGSDGQLTPLSPAGVNVGRGGLSVEVSPDRRAAYVVNRDDETISQFHISSDGTLRPLTPPAVSSGRGAQFVRFADDSRFAYVANETGKTISQFRVGQDGALTPLDPAAVTVASEPNQVFLYGHFAYASCVGGLAQFTRRSDGTLRPLAPALLKMPGTAQSVTFGPGDRFAYVANIVPGSFWQFRVGADGRLTPLPQPSLPASGTPFVVTQNVPAGCYYAADIGRGIYQFRITATGRLLPLTPNPIKAGLEPFHMTFDRTHRFAYVTGLDSDELTLMRVGNDGSLAVLGVTGQVDGFTGWPVISADNHFLYVPEHKDQVIYQFRLGPDGRATPLLVPQTNIDGYPSSITLVHLP